MGLSIGTRTLITTAVALVATASALSPSGAGAQGPPFSPTPESAVLLPPPAGPPALGAAADSLVAEMTSLVSEDSLHAFLGKLTGEVPVELEYGTRTISSRYSSSEGAERAASFLEDVLESYGYQVEIQYFSHGYVLQEIVCRPGEVSLAAGERGRILRSDGSGPWTREKAGIDTVETTWRHLAEGAPGHWVVVGDEGTAATSADDGFNWIPRSTGVAHRLLGVDLLPSGTGWAVGENGLVLTTSTNGETWWAQTSGVSAHLRAVQAIDQLAAVAVGDGGVILRTANGGLSWNAVASGVTSDLNDMFFLGTVGWAAGDLGVILHSSDAGASWAPQTSGTTRNLFSLSMSDNLHGWAAGAAATIIRTVDGGASWFPQTSPFLGPLFEVCAGSQLEGWACGLSGSPIRTVDGGAVWEDASHLVHAGWANVIATKPGTTVPEEDVLITGHYDCTSNAPDPADLAPGADDNGSGTAVVVESARTMAGFDFERTIRYICFCGEEQGLHGAEAYAARADSLGMAIAGVVNLDMVGWNDNYLRVFSNETSGWLGDIVAAMGAVYAPGLSVQHSLCPECRASDHARFWDHGFDAVMGIEPWDPYPSHYHTTGDTLGILDMTFVADVTRLSLAAVASVAGVDTSRTGVARETPRGEGPAALHRLLPVRPRPAASAVTVRFALASADFARLEVYDTLGRRVRTLLQGRLPGGDHEAAWDGRTEQGMVAAPGVYFARLSAGDTRTEQKIVLAR